MKLCPPYLAVIAVLSLAAVCQTDATEIPAIKVFPNTDCTSTPTIVEFDPKHSCSESSLNECTAATDTYTKSTVCADSYTAFLDGVFNESPYVLIKWYGTDANCETLVSAIAFLADGACQALPGKSGGFKGVVNSDNSVTFSSYDDETCTEVNESDVDISSDKINTGTCINGLQKVYTGTKAASGVSSTFFAQTAALSLLAAIGMMVAF